MPAAAAPSSALLPPVALASSTQFLREGALVGGGGQVGHPAHRQDLVGADEHHVLQPVACWTQRGVDAGVDGAHDVVGTLGIDGRASSAAIAVVHVGERVDEQRPGADAGGLEVIERVERELRAGVAVGAAQAGAVDDEQGVCAGPRLPGLGGVSTVASASWGNTRGLPAGRCTTAA